MVHMDPYGPIWTHMGPQYGSIWIVDVSSKCGVSSKLCFEAVTINLLFKRLFYNLGASSKFLFETVTINCNFNRLLVNLRQLLGPISLLGTGSPTRFCFVDYRAH